VTDVLALPFDQYQRYRLVADLVGHVRGKRKKGLKVLDVGGRTALLREFLPHDDVTLVDLEESEEEGLVLGDGSRLPFQSDAFDVVAGFDTLEHVPPDRREAFVAECARVCRGHVFLAGPYKAPIVDEAEELLQSFLKEKLGLEHRYLQEHRTNGLPVRADVEAQFKQDGAEVASFGHGNLDRWLVLMCMEMYMDHDPGLRPIAARFFRFYNEALYASDHKEPVYRHIVVAAFGGASLPSIDGLLAPPVAPPDTIASVRDLGLELVAFDREKDVWRPEFARLEGVIAGLEKDLVGHKSRLDDTHADLAQHEASLAELEAIHASTLEDHRSENAAFEADLKEHEVSLTEVRQDLKEHEESLEELKGIHAQSEAEHEDVEKVLEERAAETQRSLDESIAIREKAESDYAEMVANLRGQIAEREAGKVALEGLLAENQAGAEEMQGELLRARSDIDGLVSHMAHLDAVIEGLKAELNDRWKNLKRGLKRNPPQF
jgi:SAM-dependent methyltransferase